MALAGGIALTVPFNSGIVYNEGGMYSPDGSTRTFDANGKGTSFSDGVGIIVLKRLDDAIRERAGAFEFVARDQDRRPRADRLP